MTEFSRDGHLRHSDDAYLRARPAFKLKGGKTVKVEGGKTVTRRCGFGRRFGMDLVAAAAMLCVLLMAFEPGAKADVGASDGKGIAFGSAAVRTSQRYEARIVHPKSGAIISGATYIQLKARPNIKMLSVFIDDQYFTSGPPYTIPWNSATVTNGRHRITIAAVTPALASNALSPDSQLRLHTVQFTVHNKHRLSQGSPTPTPDPTATPIPASTPSPDPTPAPTPRPTATPAPASTPSPKPTPTPTPFPTATPPPASTPSPNPTPAPTPRPTATSTPSPSPTRSPTPTPAATPTPSPNCSIVTTVGPAIIDMSGNAWAITLGLQVSVNGVADPTTNSVIELVYSAGLVYQENSSELWWYKSSPSDVWHSAPAPSCPGATPTPIPASSPTATPASLPSPAFYINGSTGNDTNTGIASAPFQTLTRAQSAMKGSSTKNAIVEAGTYTLSANLIFTSSDNGETWLPASGLNTVTIDGANTYYIAVRGINGLSMYGFTFQHLVQDPSTTDAYPTEFYAQGSNINLRWNTFLNCPANGGCFGGGTVSNSLIDSNTFNGGTGNFPTNTSNQFASAINVGGASSNTTISHNFCENLGSGCVQADTGGGPGNEMSNITVTLNKAINTVNTCQDCGTFYHYDLAGGDSGIVFSYNFADNQVTSAQAGKGSVCMYEDSGTTGILVKGNVFKACGSWSIKTGCSTSSTAAGTNKTQFNIFDGTANLNAGGVVAFHNEYPANAPGCFNMNPNYTFSNNIVYDGNNSWWSSIWWILGNSPYPSNLMPNVTTNLWYSPAGPPPKPFGTLNGIYPAYIPNTNEFNGNPLFVNPAANDYRLQPNSPAYVDIGWTTLPTDQGPLPYSPP